MDDICYRYGQFDVYFFRHETIKKLLEPLL